MNTRKRTTLYEKLKVKMFERVLNNTASMIAEKLYLSNFFVDVNKLFQHICWQLPDGDTNYNGCSDTDVPKKRSNLRV